MLDHETYLKHETDTENQKNSKVMNTFIYENQMHARTSYGAPMKYK